MLFMLKVYKVFLDVIYFFIKLLPTKKQITLISRQSNTPSLDFQILTGAIKKELKDYKVVVLCKKLESGLFGKIKYVFYIFKLMKNIATSKIVILDSYCIPISLLKHKKDLKVIQMWHAIGLLKKAGYSILGKEEGSNLKIAKVMCMHKNYDYVLASSKECIKAMSEVFDCSQDIIKVNPLPRVDILLDDKEKEKRKKAIFKNYKELCNKKNILYAPTFRKDEIKMQIYLDKLINSVNYEKYNLIIKLHPLSKLKIENPNVFLINDFSTFDILFISDYVISDYSSIIYEAGILKKPLYFYAFDINSYDIKRGFFIDYKKEVPGIITSNVNKIMMSIEQNIYDYKKLDMFVQKYVDLSSKNNTKKLVKLIKGEL